MATSLTFNCQDSSNFFHYLSEHQCLKSYAVPLSRQNNCHVPLGLRRSVSLEDTSIDTNLNHLQKPKTQNSTLSSSLNSLCIRLQAHQLLPEFNENIAKSANEHQFDWWNSADHLRPFLQQIILHQQFTNEFIDDHEKQDQIFIQFQKSKRNKRRNAVCFAVDRLCYNEQMILFVAISNEIQIEYNLMSSGFKM
jgi:hypothetical protein